MVDFERDINLAKSGKEDLIYKTLIGLKTDLSKPAEIPEILAARQCKNDDNDTEEDCDDGESSGDDSEEEEDKNDKKKNMGKSTNIVRRKDESPESKKVRYLLYSLPAQSRILMYIKIIHVRFFRHVRKRSSKSKRRKERSK